MDINIVIPTINRKDLLLELLMAIEDQTEYFNKLLIIDNGNQSILDDINNRILVKNNKIEIYIPETNLGVAASWNYGINFFKNSDAIIFLNDDIVIGTTQLSDLNDYINNNIFWLATSTFFWSVFILTKPCWEYFLQTDGFVFDENFKTAYYEDDDFQYRVLLKAPEMFRYEVKLDPVVKRNSMTIHKDSSLNRNFDKNGRYFKQKWGGMPRHEKFKTPFNK